jgi:hypothetical protein
MVQNERKTFRTAPQGDVPVHHNGLHRQAESHNTNGPMKSCRYQQASRRAASLKGAQSPDDAGFSDTPFVVIDAKFRRDAC